MAVEPEPEEVCNRTIAVKGLGGKIPKAGTKEKPLELFVGNAGTAARFLAALVCLGNGVYRVHGVPRMHERPQGALFSALRELGYEIESANDKLPALVYGTGPRRGKCSVSIEDSSQFASALILSSIKGGWSVKVTGENAEESPYVKMTDKLLVMFPKGGGIFQIEPDASSGSYFWAASSLSADLHPSELIAQTRRLAATSEIGGVFPSPIFHVRHWPNLDLQVDSQFPNYIGGAIVLFKESRPNDPSKLSQEQLQPSSSISRKNDLGDSIMTAVVLAPFWKEPTRFIDLRRLRLQECERVMALRTELTKCGAKVVESGDMLEVFPSELHGAEIETYNDHRMAMCFAILGLKVPGIKIKNPACVKKTFPNFFQKLAATPPHGIGAEIRDAKTGRRLAVEELFAE
ncbi:MAG TPA: hypothetical protein VFA77_08555 [Candidatus Eisenbacteria bacterium]|nr:hypothetical protein [Candidatus Eisenbacteria bacterium]